MRNLLLLGLALALLACDERGFETYGGGNYLSFEKNMEKDSMVISFRYYPDQDELKIPLKMVLSGNPLAVSATYGLEVVSGETTLAPSNYKLEESYLFREGRIEDTAWIHLINSDRLQEQPFRLVIAIRGNESLQAGVNELQKAKLIVSDIAARPEWWDATVTNSYLGKYSDAKYQLFIKVTQVVDLTDMSPSKLTALALQLKYYLQKQTDAGFPVYDEENQEYMKVPVIG